MTRLALSTDRRRFLRSNIIELLAILPADSFRPLRALRLIRLIRVVRAATVLFRVSKDVRGVVGTNGLGWVMLISLATILGGALAVWAIEPTIGTLQDALWWSTVTATTVGYGDLSPESPLARVIAVVLMFVGIGTIGMLTGSIATYFLAERETSDLDVAHIRNRLGAWEQLDQAERERLVALLEVLTRRTNASAEELP